MIFEKGSISGLYSGRVVFYILNRARLLLRKALNAQQNNVKRDYMDANRVQYKGVAARTKTQLLV